MEFGFEKELKMQNLIRKISFMIPILILVFCFAGSVLAEENAPEKNWRFEGGLYFWGASIGGKSAYDTDIDVDFGDIFDSLNSAFMGMAGVRWGKWSFFTDLIYLDLKNSGAIGPGLNASVELSGWVVTPFVGYNLVDIERISLDILGGTRYFNLAADLKVNGVSGGSSGSKWDGIIGIRGKVNLTETWYLPYYLDIGTGGSRITWQGFGGVGYRFKWFDIVAAYRYLSWSFDDNKAFDNLHFNGPFVGIKFSF